MEDTKLNNRESSPLRSLGSSGELRSVALPSHGRADPDDPDLEKTVLEKTETLSQQL